MIKKKVLNTTHPRFKENINCLIHIITSFGRQGTMIFNSHISFKLNSKRRNVKIYQDQGDKARVVNYR